MSSTLAAVQASWTAAEARQFSACQLCDHGAKLSNALHCVCPALMYGGKAQPVAIVRQLHGGCGPEALYMSAAWLRASS